MMEEYHKTLLLLKFLEQLECITIEGRLTADVIANIKYNVVREIEKILV